MDTNSSTSIVTAGFFSFVEMVAFFLRFLVFHWTSMVCAFMFVQFCICTKPCSHTSKEVLNNLTLNKSFQTSSNL